ncbi:MAG TPA: glycoside hydrolase family 2 protein [Burkholderiaceae bacterium]|jgi:beta-mannosidase
MRGRIQGVSTHRRSPLEARWSLCATPAGLIETPAQLQDSPAVAWQPIAAADTVAGALRAAALWSLDAAPRRFDAEDWWFRARFDAPARSLAQARRALEFGGLAGECQVWLNGAPLLASDNMHVAHACTEPALGPTGNELLMRFPSLDATLARRRPRPRWRAPMIEHPQLRWARVSLLGRTPGWSPPAPVIGPWRAIEWVEQDVLQVSQLRLRTDVDGVDGRVSLSVELEALSGAAHIEGVILQVWRDAAMHEIALSRSESAGAGFAATLAIPNVARWWPHTHGEPALYDAQLAVRVSGSGAPVRVELGRLGFRTLTLDTSNGDFALRVNGVPVFCRGACWTPLDAVSPDATAAASRAALEQVAAAGMNMLRVNGCMVYENDAFFDACDALGLLVWQDFMFANMDYPGADATFQASVRVEAEQQLARWQARPSLAVICGNSEAEQQAAMWGSPREFWPQPLFDDDLAGFAREWCPEVPYWPSSAHGGAFPHQNNAGTTSYYGVGAYLRPMEDARRANLRFATECLAFANVPPAATLARMPGGSGLRSHHPGWKARAPRDLGAGWDFEDVRDHYLQRLYGVDPIALRSVDFERYLALSRAVGAEVVQATLSEWRRPASTCRGALIWYLRDLWAGAGWGLLDEQGAPKAAFHGLKRALAPVSVFITDEGTNGLDLHVVNDLGTALTATVEVALYRDDGLRLQGSQRDWALAAHAAETRPLADWFDGFIDLSRAYRFGPAEHALVVATLRDAAGQTLSQAFHCPEGRPSARRRDVGLSVKQVDKNADGSVSVLLASHGWAQSVYFDADGFEPEDEYFHLAPGDTRAIRLTPSRAGAKPALRGTALALNAWAGATFEIPR